MQENKHQELKNPYIFHVQESLKARYSTLRQASKIAKSHKFGIGVKPSLYDNINKVKPERKVDHHHEYLLKTRTLQQLMSKIGQAAVGL